MRKKTTRGPDLEGPSTPQTPDASPAAPPSEAEPSERTSQIAALILEVLAGARSSGDAAARLGVSLTRYYLIERRAIEGLVAACKAQPRGPRRDPEREIEKLRLELARLERECLRNQALLRISQRSTALGGVLGTQEKPLGKSQRKQRRRRKAARALLLAKGLRDRQENKTVESQRRSTENGKEDKAKPS